LKDPDKHRLMCLKMYVAELKRKRDSESGNQNEAGEKTSAPAKRVRFDEDKEELKKLGWQRGPDNLLRRIAVPQKPKIEIRIPKTNILQTGPGPSLKTSPVSQGSVKNGEAKETMSPRTTLIPGVSNQMHTLQATKTRNDSENGFVKDNAAGQRNLIVPGLANRKDLAQAKLSSRRPTEQKEHTPEERDRSPKLIKALVDLYKNGSAKKFDILKFLSEVSMTGMSLLDVLWASPSLRREVMDGLRVEPKNLRMNLLLQNPTLALFVETHEDGSITEVPKEEIQQRLMLLTMPKTSTHRLRATVAGKPMVAALDNGSCVVAVDPGFCKRMNVPMVKRTSFIKLALADGMEPAILGEVHNAVLTLDEETQIPISALVMRDLEVNALLGRPFLERTKAIIDSDRSLYHLLWNNRWLVVDGATGHVDRSVSRQLTEKELENWRYTSPPRYVKTQNVLSSIENQPRSFTIQFIGQEDGRVELKVQEDKECFDLEGALNDGTVRRSELSFLNAIPVGALPTRPTMSNDLEDTVHVNDEGNMEKFRLALLHTEELRRLYLTRVGTSERIDRLREFAPPEEVESLRILTWNVNSIRNLLRKGSVFVDGNGGDVESALPTFLARHRIDLCCVQEHRLSNEGDYKTSFTRLPGYTSYYAFAAPSDQKGYSGVSIIARDGLVEYVIDGFSESNEMNEYPSEGRFIQCCLSNDIMVLNVYAPNARHRSDRVEYKQKFLNAVLIEILSLKRRGKKVILAGDFNALYRTEDIWNPQEMQGATRESPCAVWEEEWLRKILAINMDDSWLIPQREGKYNRYTAWETGFSKGKSKRDLDHGFRIDYMLTDSKFRGGVRSCDILDQTGSDHAPVLLDLQLDYSLEEFEGTIAMMSSPITDNWKLDPQIWEVLDAKYGPFTVDLFAQKGNNHLPKYCSKDPTDIESLGSAWDQNWDTLSEKGTIWANPPWRSIPKIIRRIRESNKAVIALCIPVFPQNQYYASLLELSISNPVLLPRMKDLFLRNGNEKIGVLPYWSQTAVWFLSGNKRFQEVFKDTCPTDVRGVTGVLTTWGNYAGCYNGCWIPWRRWETLEKSGNLELDDGARSRSSSTASQLLQSSDGHNHSRSDTRPYRSGNHRTSESDCQEDEEEVDHSQKKSHQKTSSPLPRTTETPDPTRPIVVQQKSALDHQESKNYESRQASHRETSPTPGSIGESWSRLPDHGKTTPGTQSSSEIGCSPRTCSLEGNIRHKTYNKESDPDGIQATLVCEAVDTNSLSQNESSPLLKPRRSGKKGRKREHEIQTLRSMALQVREELSAEPSRVIESKIAGADLTWETYEGKKATPTQVLPKEEFGGRTINVGIWDGLQGYEEELLVIIKEYIDELLEPGGIARTLVNVPEMTVQLDPSQSGPLPKPKVPRWSAEQEKVLREYTKKMFAASKLEKSTGRTFALPILVPKKDDTYRIVFNFRPIGQRILGFSWPLDPLDKILQKMAQWDLTVVSFDHSLGYHQSPLAKECRWLTSVVFPDGLYQYTVAPMGWKDSAEWMACHTSIMYDDSEIVGDSRLIESLALYRDDGSVGTNQGGKDGLELLRRWFECVKRHNGTISDKKSYFWIEHFHALGFLLGKGLIIPEESKIRAVEAWQFPEDQKALKGFNGFTGFFKHCVPNLQLIVSPLFHLYKKEFGTRKSFVKEWSLDSRYARAFMDAKKAVTDAAALKVINPKRPLLLACDASPTGIAAVAGHAMDERDDDNLSVETKYYPCAFWSRPLTETEQRYSHPEKECLAQVYGAMKAEPYVGRKLVFLLDASSWVLAQNESKNKRVDKWRMRLAQLPQDDGYPKILFRPGSEHLDVDPLSRLEEKADINQVTLDDIIEEAVEDPVVLKVNQLIATIIRLGWKPYDDILQYLLKGTLPADPKKAKSIRAQSKYYLVDTDQKALLRRATGFGIHRVVPKAEDVQKILEEYHGSTEIGCHNSWNTYQMIAQRYYWDGMLRDIEDFVKRCAACVRRSRPPEAGRYKLFRIIPPATLFVMLGMDTCSLPKGSYGYNAILTLVDYTSSLIRVYPLKSMKAPPMVQAVETWCRNYGYPQWIIDDKAKYFEGDAFKQWAAEKKVQLIPTAVQHPEGNGKAEKANDIIVTFMARRLIKRGWKPGRWPDVRDESMSDALHHLSRMSGISAYQCMYGQTARTPQDNEDFPIISTEEELQELRRLNAPMIEKLRTASRVNIVEAQRKSEEDRGASNVIIYRPGELVWVYDRADESTFATERKLRPRWELCRINQALSRASYTVTSAITGKPLKQGDGAISHWRLKKAHMPKEWYQYVLKDTDVDESSPFDEHFGRPELQPAEEDVMVDPDKQHIQLLHSNQCFFEEASDGSSWMKVGEPRDPCDEPGGMRCRMFGMFRTDEPFAGTEESASELMHSKRSGWGRDAQVVPEHSTWRPAW